MLAELEHRKDQIKLTSPEGAYNRALLLTGSKELAEKVLREGRSEVAMSKLKNTEFPK